MLKPHFIILLQTYDMAINSLSYYNNCNILVSVTKECLLMTRGHMLNVFAPVLDRQGCLQLMGLWEAEGD